MALAHFQRAITDDAGNLMPGTVCTVTRESDGGLAALKSNRAGSSSHSNPITVGSDGILDFYVVGAAYRIAGVLGAFSFDWRYVGIGTAQETDFDSLSGDIVINGSPTGVRIAFDTTTTASDPGAGKWRANHATFASITALYVDNTDSDAGDITGWLDAMDGHGSSDLRGVLRTENIDDPKEWAEFDVEGSVTDSTGYRTLTVSPRAEVGWPFANGVMTPATFTPAGVTGPGATVAVGTVTDVAYGAGASVTNVGTATDAVLDFEIPAGPTGLQGDGLDYDQIVADITARDAVTTPVGVRVAVSDIGDGRSAVYELIDDSPQTWSDPLYISGVGGGGGGSGLLKCRTVALSNVAIATELENGDTLNGVTLATDDVVLLTAQTADEENGPYVVVASGAASRHSDYADFDAVAGSYFAVLEGTARADTLWVCTSDAGGTIDTDPLEFEQFMGNEDDYGLITGAVSGGDDYGSIA